MPMIEKKNVLALIIIALMLGVLYFLTFQRVSSEVAFSYTMNVIPGPYTENTTPIVAIDKNNVFITAFFIVPSPCYNVSYQLVKNESVINIFAENGPSLAEFCAQVVGFDTVEINMTVPSGNYRINFYSLFDKETPEFSKEFIINQTRRFK